MRSLTVVELAPLFGDNFGFTSVPEDFHSQTFVSKLAVETLAFPVLPRAARLNIRRLDIILNQKFLDDSGDKFAAVVRPQKFRITALCANLP